MNLKGILPDKAVQALNQLDDKLTLVSQRFTSLSQKPLLTKPHGDLLYGAEATRNALQVGGSHPLNISALIGIPSPLTNLPVYANNAAAIAGGLFVGSFYRTGADPDLVAVVH